jgi:DNA polymerase-3 subunit epsilon
MPEALDPSIAAALALLNAHPDFKVTRRLAEHAQYSVPDGRPLSIGVVLDTETTGLDHDRDEVIELGMLAFEYDPANGEVFGVRDVFTGFEEPARPIDPASTAVHGITNEMVTGMRFDEARVARFVDNCSLVVAHNARFDRPFVEARFPVFEQMPWGCSFAQVDWEAGGIGARKLEHIAHHMGIFYDAHRALADCRALLHVLQAVLPATGRRPLASIIEAANQTSHRIWARGSRFDTKDALKARGYRWDGQERCWHVEVPAGQLQRELAWLGEAVYQRQPATAEIELLDALNRFTRRPSQKESVRL